MGSVSLVGSETKGFAKTLVGSLGLVSTVVEHSSFFRVLTGSLNLTSSPGEHSALFRTLTGSLTTSSGLAGHLSVSRALTESISLPVSETNGQARTLMGPRSLPGPAQT